MLLATLSAFASFGGVTIPSVDPPKPLDGEQRPRAIVADPMAADSMALGWRRRLNAVDESGATFLLGDWRISCCCQQGTESASCDPAECVTHGANDAHSCVVPCSDGACDNDSYKPSVSFVETHVVIAVWSSPSPPAWCDGACGVLFWVGISIGTCIASFLLKKTSYVCNGKPVVCWKSPPKLRCWSAGSAKEARHVMKARHAVPVSLAVPACAVACLPHCV